MKIERGFVNKVGLVSIAVGLPLTVAGDNLANDRFKAEQTAQSTQRFYSTNISSLVDATSAAIPQIRTRLVDGHAYAIRVDSPNSALVKKELESVQDNFVVARKLQPHSITIDSTVADIEGQIARLRKEISPTNPISIQESNSMLEKIDSVIQKLDRNRETYEKKRMRERMWAVASRSTEGIGITGIVGGIFALLSAQYMRLRKKDEHAVQFSNRNPQN